MDKKGGITWSIVGLCLLTLSLSGSTEETTLPSETVTIVDSTGLSVDLSCPVERIVSITSAASEVICALDAGDRIVGRDSYSLVTPYLEDAPVVAGSSASPNIELILELDPDVVIADTMLSDDLRERIEEAGIPVIVESAWDATTVITVVRNFGMMLDKEERADEIIGFIEQYQYIIEERIASLEEADKPAVYFEFYKPYFTSSSGTPLDNLVTVAGGINIAREESTRYPTVSPEWIVERNPDIIISILSATEDITEEMLEETRDEILSRQGLNSVKAVEDDRVYVLCSAIRSGVLSIVGELYLAKWFHPDLFEDIDPEEVHEELIQEFFGQKLEGVYVYP
jgi:iron complex transport system substrate-binding protein